MKDGKLTSRERGLQHRQSCLWAVRAIEIISVCLTQCSPLPVLLAGLEELVNEAHVITIITIEDGFV